MTANLPYTATTGSPNQYTINFDAAAEAQGFADVTNIALPATPIGITIPPAAIAGTYNATITVLNTTSGCVSATAQPITITIEPAASITLGTGPTVCPGVTSATIGYTGSVGSPNQYSINYDGPAEIAGFTDVALTALPATSIGLTIPAAAPLGTYNGTITVINTLTGCTSAPLPFTVTVNPPPTITLGANPSVCVGSATANLAIAELPEPEPYTINTIAAADSRDSLIWWTQLYRFHRLPW